MKGRRNGAWLVHTKRPLDERFDLVMFESSMKRDDSLSRTSSGNRQSDKNSLKTHFVFNNYTIVSYSLTIHIVSYTSKL